MHTSNLMTFKFLLAVPLCFALTTHSSSVYANWWEQGADLLKSVQQSQTSDSKDSKIVPGLPINLSNEEIQKAFKEALTKGSETVVNKLGVKDGFNADPKVHIPLPKSLKTVQSTLNQFGMGKYMDNLETKLNRAAEAATPQAKALFYKQLKI
jgi:hypothetical protein